MTRRCASSHAMAWQLPELPGPCTASPSDASAEDASDELGSDAQLSKVRALADRISRMAILRPEVLRVTAAHNAFSSCFAPLRPGERHFFEKSREASEIDEFWSHSWQGRAWQKGLTLLVLNNGLVAICVGNFCALLGMVLFLLGVLPGFKRNLPHETESFAWSEAFGVVGTFLTLLFWRSRKKVFLDGICISNTDMALKTEAICSLAGMLDKSRSMLVLWDASFAERLWCIFEIAAFLKSKEGRRERRLVVCPTLTGPASFAVTGMMMATVAPLALVPQSQNFFSLKLAGMLFACSLCGLASCHVFRGFYRSVETMQAQLLSLQVTDLKCSCCSAGHVYPDGRRMICDRQVISECIAIWFGSTDDFVRCIRAEVVDVITGQLEENAFSIAWSLAVNSPFLWAMLDMFQRDMSTSVATHFALIRLFVGISLMLLLCPVWTEWSKFLAYRLRHESSSWSGELLRDVLMGLFILPGILLAAGPFLSLRGKTRPFCFSPSSAPLLPFFPILDGQT